MGFAVPSNVAISSVTTKKIGLIAGNGTFPLLLAEQAQRQGDQVVAVGLKEEADPSLEKWANPIAWHSIGQLGKTIDFFKEHGVTRAIMAGQVKHTQLFRDIVPDWRVTKMLARVANKKAESLLNAVTEEFEKEGIEFLPSITYLEKWVAREGLMSKRSLSTAEKQDIAFGLPLARTIAAQDIGQTLVVKDQTIVAVEAMEGTDACIRRAGEVAGPGCVVIKVARPKQDLRFDVPVIGNRTLESMKAAGAKVLAVEAGKTLLLDLERLRTEANASDLTLTGF